MSAAPVMTMPDALTCPLCGRATEVAPQGSHLAWSDHDRPSGLQCSATGQHLADLPAGPPPIHTQATLPIGTLGGAEWP